MIPKGVNRLLHDLEKLYNERETCDVVFTVGPEEARFWAHKIILRARCDSFQGNKRGEICNIQGTTVSASSDGRTCSIIWPKAKPNVLEKILKYIYCAKIDFRDVDIFEILSISMELGLEDLKEPCVEYFNENLCFDTACTYLAASLELDDRLNANQNNPFVEQCISYVGKHAFDCFQTSSFLNLSKDALIHLISSDSLALEEEEVWRGVLNWARHQTGVHDPVSLWSEDQRSKIKQALTGVINHVRILLIDSQVFAEEVEPTGAVPIEVSLERYRLAALPSKFAHQNDRRRVPRSSDRFFQNTNLLNDNNVQFQQILNEWFGSPKQIWKLIFRASLNGFSASAFHEHCDNHAPTYVIVSGHNGDLCGGFTNVPWSSPADSRGRYATSEKTFLFTLINRDNQLPTRFEVIKKRLAVVHHRNFGPTFGGGADLAISDNCDANLKSYSNLPHSFDGEGASNTILMGEYNFCVKEYEVFAPLTGVK